MRSVTRCIGPLLFAVLGLPGTGFAQKAELPSAAQFASGETWEWRQFDQRTKLEEGRQSRTVVSADGELRVSDSVFGQASVASVFTDNYNKSSAKPWRVWPLEIGKKWSVNVDWSRPDGVTGNTKQEAEVVAYEEVTVPAGKFMAFKIEQRGWFQNSRPNRGKQNDTYWYAPEERADVKHSRDDGVYSFTRELVSHKRSAP